MDFDEFIEIFYIPDSEYSKKQFKKMQSNFAVWLFELPSDKLEMLHNLKPCASCKLRISRYCDWCIYGNARNLYEENHDSTQK